MKPSAHSPSAVPACSAHPAPAARWGSPIQPRHRIRLRDEPDGDLPQRRPARCGAAGRALCLPGPWRSSAFQKERLPSRCSRLISSDGHAARLTGARMAHRCRAVLDQERNLPMRVTLTLVCTLLLAVPVAGQTPGTSGSDERAVKDLVARYNAARDNQDPAAIRALFTADADQLVSSGEWRRGREQLVEGMLRELAHEPGRSHARRRDGPLPHCRCCRGRCPVQTSRVRLARRPVACGARSSRCALQRAGDCQPSGTCCRPGSMPSPV